MATDEDRKLFKNYFNDMQIAVISELTSDEKRAFGFTGVDGYPVRMKKDQAEKALALARQALNGRLKYAVTEFSAAAKRIQQQGLEEAQEAQIQTEGETTVVINEKQEETSKAIIVPAGAEPLLISTADLAELAGAITKSIGTPLHLMIEEATESAIEYQNITDGPSYIKACEHRKKLRALIATMGDLNDAGRMRVRVTMAIVDAAGQKIAIATETTIGTRSVADLYGPLSTMLDKLHKATTQGRSLVTDQIESCRKLLERAALAWEDQQESARKELERLQALKQAQIARTDTAKHWIQQLVGHGYSLEACQALLDHSLEEVTDQEVKTLESLLRDKLVEEETAKQKKELAEAIETAKGLDMPEVVKELETQANAPIVVEAPPPPPPSRPALSTVAQTQTPKAKGQGRSTHYTIQIDYPDQIPAKDLLPPDDKLYDPEAYVRLRARARAEGMSLKVPGITVIPEAKLTQR